MRITIKFSGAPGDRKDLFSRAVFEYFGGEFLGGGTCLIAGIRDVEYEVPNDVWQPLTMVLSATGFEVSPR